MFNRKNKGEDEVSIPESDIDYGFYYCCDNGQVFIERTHDRKPLRCTYPVKDERCKSCVYNIR